jgi:hypothetical protein
VPANVPSYVPDTSITDSVGNPMVGGAHPGTSSRF